MRDKEIRSILIAYLKANNQEVRIYQEKNIGSAICDVMAVTDKLIGFEIKSDSDNYQRLERQIAFYDKFFDKNYIVVSKKHIASIEAKAPEHWGIIYVDNNDIRIVKKASVNNKVSRRNQLTILWKIELKNLLIKNCLPLYAQKDKGYIMDEIYKKVELGLLGKQIANELMKRDYSVYDAKDYTIYNKQEMPSIEIIDSLSEQNFDQLTFEKWIELYQIAKDIQKEKEIIHAKQDVNRTPHDITYKDIEASLGVPWINKKIVNNFVNYIINGNNNGEYYNLVKYEPVTGAWHIDNKNHFRNSNVDTKYGTNCRNALYIIESILNLREIKLYNNNGTLNEIETVAVLEKQKLINAEFKRWVWEDEDRIWEIEKNYNKIFTGYTTDNFDGSKLSFPEMNPEIELFDYQKDAIQRIISTPNTLLAFDVGAGKTYIMIAAAMKMRQMGISRKNLFVVPNNITGQWEKIFTLLYPNAKILTVEPGTFKPAMREKVMMQMKNGDYDGIIIAYSCFEQIPLSSEYLSSNLQEKIDEINGSAKNYSIYVNRWERSAIQREIEYIKKLTASLLKKVISKNSCVTFDTLDINTIFLDEAHNFKNIPIRTKLKNLRGINTSGSAHCHAMLQKVRCVQKSNNGRGAVLATGTPLCNSISDVYTMQMYLQYDALRACNLEKFDNWVKTFSQTELVCEVDVTASNYRFVCRFAKFFNLPELSKMFSSAATFYSMALADHIPQHTAYTDIQVKKCDELDKYMKNICKRAEKIRNRKVHPKEDNMLKVSTDGRKAALDLTLVHKAQPYDQYSKLVKCCNQVLNTYRAYPGCTQLVFCDFSVPKASEFNVYSKIKELLCEKGIDKNEIAFIHNYKTESTKLKLFHDVNAGKIRVLIGSTSKLGIGTNVQTKLKAIHHLDVPWRPADMTQREGRILRRGNENEEIFIFRYITEGSFDSYSWQILETKQKFISQFLSGSSYQRSIEDLDNNVLSYAEVKALALGNPIMKQIAEKENEIKTLQILCNKDAENKRKLTERISKLEKEIPMLKEGNAVSLKNEKYLSSKTNDMYLREMKASKDILTQELINAAPSGKVLMSFLGFDVVAKEMRNDKLYISLKRVGMEYSVEMGSSAQGNIKRIVNFLKRFGSTVRAEQERVEKMQNECDEAKKSLSLPNEHYDKLKKCKEEYEELMETAKMRNLVE